MVDVKQDEAYTMSLHRAAPYFERAVATTGAKNFVRGSTRAHAGSYRVESV